MCCDCSRRTIRFEDTQTISKLCIFTSGEEYDVLQRANGDKGCSDVHLLERSNMKIPDLATFVFNFPSLIFPNAKGHFFRLALVAWRAIVVVGAIYVTVASVYYEIYLWSAYR